MLLYWVNVAKLEGRIYENSFSAAASLNTPAERHQTAITPVGALEQAYYG
jgi:hypothetical protein